MSVIYSIGDDDSDEGSILDSCAATGTALIEPDDVEIGASATEEWTGARCEKCEAPLASDIVSICRHCGWYASLGRFVEIDPDWEVATGPETAKVQEPRKSHLQVWLSLMPRWSWVIIATVMVVVIESIVARLATPADSWIRTTWSLTQLMIGLVAAIGCHVLNFVTLATEDSEFGLLDVLLRPLKLWGRAIENLPTRLWVANATVSGIAAALLSLLVIGGIPYERLWDWGFKQPAKQDLIGAVMSEIQKAKGDEEKDLEKSINDFAGKQGDEKGDKPKADPPKPTKNADCVILGYKLDRDGRLVSLVLGAADAGQLVYAGSVAPKLSDENRSELLLSLLTITTDHPIIHIEADAKWVRPTIACRVNFTERAKNGQLRDIKWDTLLGSIEKRR